MDQQGRTDRHDGHAFFDRERDFGCYAEASGPASAAARDSAVVGGIDDVVVADPDGMDQALATLRLIEIR